jgi:hypothetical protein
MVWRRVTENLLGGNYTWYDSAVEGVELYPLIYCVGNAFPARDRETYWYYVPALFDDINSSYAGGDPDWLLAGEVDEQGKVVYRAQSSTDISGLEPPSGDYDEALVKKYFARTMREYARVHPESNAKIQELIDKYQLESAASPRLIAEGQAPDDQGP